jgi:hypothetical protein
MATEVTFLALARLTRRVKESRHHRQKKSRRCHSFSYVFNIDVSSLFIVCENNAKKTLYHSHNIKEATVISVAKFITIVSLLVLWQI